MRILIVTQKIDRADENLGFFHRWVEEFAKHYSHVVVIAHAVGEYNLPSNVVCHSLGKEKNTWRIHRLWKFWKLFSYYYAHSDAVFFHMIPQFVLAASPFLISLKKPSALWYVHKSVTRSLKLAERLVDTVFTASSLSFRLPSKKVMYTGHAIDTKTFEPVSDGNQKGGLRILALGRISPVKDYETMIRAGAILKDIMQGGWTISIVGGPLMRRDENYFAKLKKMVSDLGLESYIIFQGSRPFTEVPEIYREHDIFVSMSTTGSIDKTVLEAMSSGLTVITSNEAFAEFLKPPYYLEKRSAELLAERIKSLAKENRPNMMLRDLVEKNHSLEGTITKIVHTLTAMPIY